MPSEYSCYMPYLSSTLARVNYRFGRYFSEFCIFIRPSSWRRSDVSLKGAGVSFDSLCPSDRGETCISGTTGWNHRTATLLLYKQRQNDKTRRCWKALVLTGQSITWPPYFLIYLRQQDLRKVLYEADIKPHAKTLLKPAGMSAWE